MNTQDQPGTLAYCVSVILNPGPIGRSHFAYDGARANDNIGYSKSVADLDQLPTRDDRLASVREFIQNEIYSGRIIVHYNSGLSALAGRQVVFEVRIASQRLKERQGSSSEICVENHSGRVDDTAQGELTESFEALLDLAFETGVTRRFTAPQRGSFLSQYRSNFVGDYFSRQAVDRAELAQYFVDRGKIS